MNVRPSTGPAHQAIAEVMPEGVALPEFDEPPINESALSIQFQPLASFGIPHFGLYWETIRQAFPKFQLVPPVAQVTEEFVAAKAPRLNLQLLGQPDVRCWFLTKTGERLVQLQRDHFIYNWRQVKGGERYPRYPALREELLLHWNGFQRFLTQQKIPVPEVNQCEVTYVNHIEYELGWRGFSELEAVVAPWSGKHNGNFLRDPEHVSIEAHYRLPEERGRLHIVSGPVVRGRDMKEVLQVALTARGAPQSSSTDDILRWLDLGREWVVRGFADFTAEPIQRLWRRRK